MSDKSFKSDLGPDRDRVIQASQYIARHRASYSVMGLRQKLAEFGYTEAEIAAAYKEVDQPRGPGGVPVRTIITVSLVIGAAILLIACGYCLVNFKI
jgi:hypothetical protein